MIIESALVRPTRVDARPFAAPVTSTDSNPGCRTGAANRTPVHCVGRSHQRKSPLQLWHRPLCSTCRVFNLDASRQPPIASGPVNITVRQATSFAMAEGNDSAGDHRDGSRVRLKRVSLLQPADKQGEFFRFCAKLTARC